MFQRLFECISRLTIVSYGLIILIFPVDGAIVSGLVQETTVIGGSISYFPFGQGDLPLSTQAGSPTKNTKLGWAVSSTPAASQPTLVYNCQQMAAICNNVQQWLGTRTLPMEFTYDLTTAKSYKSLRALLEPGYLPSQKTMKAIRGNQMCGGVSWSQKKCPESNQPATIRSRFQSAWTIISVISRSDGTPGRVIDGVKDPTTGQYTELSGMQYTCDEFPPASFIEGGAGPDGNSAGTTYCAPQGLSCGRAPIDASSPGAQFVSKQNPTKPNAKIFEQSEQDFQSKIHGYLSNIIGKLYPGGKNKVLYGAFQFTTLAAPNTVPSTSRAWVVIPTVIAGVPSTSTSAYVLKRETDPVLPIWHGIPPEFIRLEARYEKDIIQHNDSNININELPQSYNDGIEKNSATEAPYLESILRDANHDYIHLRGPTTLFCAGVLFSIFGAVVLGISVLQYRRSRIQYAITKV